MGSYKSYFGYWGKAKPATDDQDVRYHLLPYHSLDVAAVASQWWDQSAAIRRAFVSNIGISEKQAKAWVLFFVALHDLGKIDIRFQLKSPASLQGLRPDISPDDAAGERKYYHGPQGFLAFRRQISKKIGVDFDSWQSWLAAVCGHHGVLQMSGSWQAPDAEDWVIARDEKARAEWVDALIDLYLKPVGIDWQQPLPNCSPLLAGFCSVCDWVGSNPEFFKYCSDDSLGMGDYWKSALKVAAPLVQEMGLHKELSGVAGMSELFPDLEPRQFQATLSQFNLESGLTLIEAPTGSGKTETALALASQLLATNRADSIIFALPTQATANAMLERLEVVAGKLYEGNTNIVLAHGRARFSQDFQRIKSAAEMPNAQGVEAAQVQCAQWLGESRKRVFLGQIGVCTIDQVLISVLPVRHNFVRSFGLQKSVLIVDEVHAYDAYMYGLLTCVLSAQQQAGGSAILLSATLPAEHKNKLLDAWGARPDDASANTNSNGLQPYPLVTQVYQNQVGRIQIEDKDQLPEPREVQVELVATEDCLPDEDLMLRLLEAAEQGALVGIVCNLVADAQQLYQRLVELCGQSNLDIPVDLFHARYCFAHRQQHEQQVLDFYGKGDKRARGRILVATQVIEQSLDLDFDWLVSQICPVDLLFQRLGRLHRHERNNRPANFAGVPRAVVLVPVEEDDFGLHQLVYASGRFLWRTKELLQETPTIQFPAAYREWIEKVYDDESWQDEPEAIQKSHEDYETKSQATYYCARQLANTEYSPAADTDENVACMTRDGDMNLSVLLLQESTKGLTTLTGTALKDLDEWDQKEAMLLSTVGAPASWRKWLPDPDIDGVVRIEMTEVANEWSWRGNKNYLNYNELIGLSMEKHE